MRAIKRAILPERENGSLPMAEKLRKRGLIPLFLISIGGAMAGDLRMVSAALKMTTDMERIGDHATNIAQWAMFAMTGEMPKD